MKKTILLVLFCTAVQEGLGNHVFVPIEMTWSDAQAYCREKYFDLSSIESQSDQDSLKAAAGGNIVPGWIGLYRDSITGSEWMWSGGEILMYENWDDEQPDNSISSGTVVEIMANGKWNHLSPISISLSSTKRPFYCFSFSDLQVKKTWEEALEHCRETHSDLTSLHSETDTYLALSEMENNYITEPVWIGLRFLGDTWLWVDGDPLVYEAWLQGDQDYQCPIWRHCGALTEDGLWENWDCQEKRHFICK